MVNWKTTYSRRPRHSHPGNHPGHRRVESSAHTVPCCTRNGSLDRLVSRETETKLNLYHFVVLAQYNTTQ